LSQHVEIDIIERCARLSVVVARIEVSGHSP
jgi:hypothetical protein